MPETQTNTLLKSSNPLKAARRSTGCSTTNWSTCPPFFLIFPDLSASFYIPLTPTSLCIVFLWPLAGCSPYFSGKIEHIYLGGRQIRDPHCHLWDPLGFSVRTVSIYCGLFEKGHIYSLHQGEKESKRIVETTKTGLRTFERIIKAWDDSGKQHIEGRNGVKNKARMSMFGNYLNV